MGVRLRFFVASSAHCDLLISLSEVFLCNERGSVIKKNEGGLLRIADLETFKLNVVQCLGTTNVGITLYCCCYNIIADQATQSHERVKIFPSSVIS